MSSKICPAECSILTFPGGSARWHLVNDYLELRSRVFIGRKSWDLHSPEGYEFEQYDVVGSCTYVLVHDGHKVQAGCRLMRTDTKIGDGKFAYSYMIRDAWRGLISLPPSICDVEPPADHHHWELTRMVTRGSNREASLRCMYAAFSYLSSVGAKGCLCLGSPSVMRLASIYGFDVKALGPLCSNKDGSFRAFEVTGLNRARAIEWSE